ncbi:MAG TPA: glycosyltransferase 87 family protein, partial [Propionicimonas sp.]|nr:glycosyltransferase 87 family protein [Propionicimonas sp.]
MPRRAMALILWLAAAAALAVPAANRFQGALADAPGYDLAKFFLPAAQSVAAGGSPYAVTGYVYSPLVASILAPLADRADVGAIWSAGQIGAGLLAALGIAWGLYRSWTDWRTPVLFGIGGLTLLSNWVTTLDLRLGQIQLTVMLVLVVAWLAGRGRPGLAGAMIGVAGLIKTWPAFVVLWALRLRGRARRRGLVGFTVIGTLAVVLTLAAFGPGSVGDWADTTGSHSQQTQPVFSVWGVWKHVFAGGTRIDPWFVSPVLQVAATVVALALVVVLLVLTLRPARD